MSNYSDEKKIGGSAANVACDISGLGFKSSFLGCVGDDVSGTVNSNQISFHKEKLNF